MMSATSCSGELIFPYLSLTLKSTITTLGSYWYLVNKLAIGTTDFRPVIFIKFCARTIHDEIPNPYHEISSIKCHATK